MASATRDAAEATSATVDEMRAVRRQETAPHIIAYFDVPYGSQLIYFVVGNIGKGTATEVSLEFSPPLQSSSQDLIDGLEFLRTGFASMPPDYEFRTFLDSTIQYLGTDNLPLNYDMSIKYSGGLMEGCERRTVALDLGHLRGRMFATQKGVEDLAKSVESLRKGHEKVARTLDHIDSTLGKGLYVRNASMTVVGGSPASFDEARAMLFTKLHEFVALWSKSAAAERATGIRSV